MGLVMQLNSTQQQVLKVLADAPRQLNVSEIAERVDLHANTVREILARLLELELVIRTRTRSGTRGRPFWLYEAVVTTDLQRVVQEIATLGAAVAEQMQRHASDPQTAALGLGKEWGSQILGRQCQGPKSPEGEQHVDVTENRSEQSKRIQRYLSRLGFEARPGDAWFEINLFQCPLLREDQEISPLICQIHQGMTAEVVDRLSGQQLTCALIPFAGPGHCRLALLES